MRSCQKQSGGNRRVPYDIRFILQSLLLFVLHFIHPFLGSLLPSAMWQHCNKFLDFILLHLTIFFFLHTERGFYVCGSTTVGECTRSKSLELYLYHPCNDIVSMDLDSQWVLSQTYAQSRSWQSLEPFTISVAIRNKYFSLSWMPEYFLYCMNYQYTLETKIFKWDQDRAQPPLFWYWVNI